jgi:hypothetical protein
MVPGFLSRLLMDRKRASVAALFNKTGFDCGQQPLTWGACLIIVGLSSATVISHAAKNA